MVFFGYPKNKFIRTPKLLYSIPKLLFLAYFNYLTYISKLYPGFRLRPNIGEKCTTTSKFSSPTINFFFNLTIKMT